MECFANNRVASRQCGARAHLSATSPASFCFGGSNFRALHLFTSILFSFPPGKLTIAPPPTHPTTPSPSSRCLRLCFATFQILHYVANLIIITNSEQLRTTVMRPRHHLVSTTTRPAILLLVARTHGNVRCSEHQNLFGESYHNFHRAEEKSLHVVTVLEDRMALWYQLMC